MTRVLGIAGSLRQGSHNARLLLGAERQLPSGVELVVYEGLRDVPPYDQDEDVEPAPAPVARLREAIAEADALLVATPEYNASVPGQLKNALDWASRPFPANALRNKPAAVIGASTGAFGAVWAQAEVRKVLARSGARVLDGELPVPFAHEAVGPDGELADEQLAERLAELLRGLAGEVDARRAVLAA